MQLFRTGSPAEHSCPSKVQAQEMLDIAVAHHNHRMPDEWLDEKPAMTFAKLPGDIYGIYDSRNGKITIDLSKTQTRLCCQSVIGHELHHLCEGRFKHPAYTASCSFSFDLFTEAAAFFAGADCGYFSCTVPGASIPDGQVSGDEALGVISEIYEDRSVMRVLRHKKTDSSDITSDYIKVAKKLASAVLECSGNEPNILFLRLASTLNGAMGAPSISWIARSIAALAFIANNFDVDRAYCVLNSTPKETLSSMAGLALDAEKAIGVVEAAYSRKLMTYLRRDGESSDRF